MREAGFNDFERGERGSTAEHLSVLEYKNQQEAERAATLGQTTEKRQKRLEKLDEQIAVKTKAAATVAQIGAMGKPALLGGVNLTPDETDRLKTLAKKGVTADERVSDMRRRLKAAEKERDEVKARLAAEQKSRPSIKENLTWFDKFTAAMKRAPARLMAVIDEILRQPPERQEPEKTPERKKDRNMEH
jgi:hypothetical protein